MKVVFNLTKEQVKAARAVVASVKAEDAMLEEGEGVSHDGYVYMGNLAGYYTEHLCLNTDANLYYAKGKITWVGQRCPFWQDGYMKTLKEILGDDYKSWDVSFYQTSDRRLKWWETQETWALEQVKQGKADGNKVLRWVQEADGRQWPLLAVQEAIRRIPGPAGAAKPGTAEYRKAVAAGTVEQSRLKQKLIDVLMGAWGHY